jgi:hypothetical protein
MEFSAYLRAKRVRAKLNAERGGHQGDSTQLQKQEVILLTRAETARIDTYVTAKENTAASAQPSLSYVENEGICPEAAILKSKLAAIQTGTNHAAQYQKTVLEILNYLFNPELITGELEVRTIDGTERRDIIFTNDSDKSFWDYIRNEHSSIFLMFEIKNVPQLENTHINQTATYLGDRLGRLGFIVTRKRLEEAQLRKTYSVYNDSQPRKIVLVFCDDDINAMIDMRCEGKDPMLHVQKAYRAFRTGVQ